MVPSFGAVMFSKGFKKILFCNKIITMIQTIVVYPPDKNEPRKLDFPKGKADQAESDVECAVREIGEEIGFIIRPLINEEQYIRIETIQGKFVKLFLVSDVDEEKVLSDHRKLI